MNILVLNGSPRPAGSTKKMIDAFREGAESVGHRVTVLDVCRMNIHGCLACEYCHTRGNGKCVQQDDMEQVYAALNEADLLVLASPIYYHNISGQLKCAIDRFYAAATLPTRPPRLTKIAFILSSGSPDMYVGARFSFEGDFLDYLGLEDMGFFTSSRAENGSPEKLQELRAFGVSLR